MAEVLAWAKVSLHPDRSAGGIDSGAGRGGSVGKMPPLLQAELQLKLRRAKFLELQTQELEGRLHDAEECRRRRLGLIQGAKARLLDLGRSVAADLVGKERDEIERILAERIRRVLMEWARGDGSEVRSAECGVPSEKGEEKTGPADEGAASAGDGQGG